MGRQWMRGAAAAALVWALAPQAGAADLNGPMSSSPPAPPEFDVNKLFASTCGWCHSSGGRAAGRGPKLMDTALTDAEIAGRIKSGKTGAMPAFGSSFSDEQIAAIIRYIRALKSEGVAQ
jgi:mono/diheme cytochrome c family protein